MDGAGGSYPGQGDAVGVNGDEVAIGRGSR